MTVKILSASLEEDELTDDVIIRGVLDQESLKHIGMAWYQRERGFSNAHNHEIISALMNGSRVADITLGMRGERVRSTKTKDNGEVYSLLDRCFCIDGGQRVYSAGMALKKHPELRIRLGVKAYLGTTEESENELFCTLNTTQARVGSSVLIRNRKKKSRAAAALVALNENPDFALAHRVAWDQRKDQHELMMGFSVSQVLASLHCHLVGGLKNAKTYELLHALDQLVEKIGEENFTTNAVRFFNAIDKCWTIRQLSGHRNESRPHLKLQFLKTIARLFSRYTDFWDGTKRHEFNCMDKYLRKLKTFPLNKYLIASTVPTHALYEVIRKHIKLDPTFEQTDESESGEDEAEAE